MINIEPYRKGWQFVKHLDKNSISFFLSYLIKCKIYLPSQLVKIIIFDIIIIVISFFAHIFE